MANLRVSLRKRGASNFETGDKIFPETDWGFILNKPPTFVPDPHNHSISQITGLQGVLDGKLELKGALGTTDLNTLNNEASQGIYYQNANVNATLARNYPTASSGAGVLKVYWSSANSGVVQEYNNYQNGRLYVRAYQGGTWSGWSTIADRDWVTANTRSNTWVPSWSQVTSKPTWIGSSKPNYDLSEISETTTYKRVTQTDKNNWNLKADITDIEDKIGEYDDQILPIINSKLSSSLKGAANGVAELDANGKVPAVQLPSFVDDVLEYTALASFPTTGESGKIYIDLTTNKTYRWGGSGYVVISDTISLGETISTAYRGDRGKIAYDHSQAAHAPSNAQKNSDITKAEIEAKLTGTITSHTHTYNLDQINEGSTYKRVTQSEKDGWNSKQNALGYTPENVANKRTSIRTSGADNTSYVSELGVKTYVDGIAATKQDSLGFTPVPTTRTIAGLNLTTNRSRDQILGTISGLGYYRRTGTDTYDIRTVDDLKSDLGLGSAAYANISAFKSNSWPNGSESQYVRGDGSLATFPTISQNLELLRSRSGTNSLTSNTMNSVKGVGAQLTRGDTIMFEVLHTSGVSTTTPKVVTATVGSAANSNSHERSITYTTWDGAEQRVYSMSVALISNELIFGNANYMRIYKSGSDMVVSNSSWTPYIGRVWKVVGV